jgi:hypothetical protein
MEQTKQTELEIPIIENILSDLYKQIDYREERIKSIERINSRNKKYGYSRKIVEVEESEAYHRLHQKATRTIMNVLRKELKKRTKIN